MFVEPIVKRFETKIRSALSHASGTAIALIPLIVAVGFATAAADSFLEEKLGARTAYLTLSGAYLLIALAIYATARMRER